MQQNGASLAALIGSRICHDLINPIGAISNGLELFGMGGASPDGPEMTLIQQSCDNATARIRFFRVAFGSAGDTRPIAPAEAAQTLANHYAGTRILTDWQIETALPRDLTQLAYLGVLCVEPCLPQGGTVTVTRIGDHLSVLADGSELRRMSPMLDLLTQGNGAPCPDLRPADVQFPLLGTLCADRDCTPQVTADAKQVQIAMPLLN